MPLDSRTAHPFFEYSRTVLAFRLGTTCRANPADAVRPADMNTAAARAIRMLERTGRQRLLLLGLGDGALAAMLAESLPPEVELTVCEADPECVRLAAKSDSSGAEHPHFPAWAAPRGNRQLLVDGSPHALFLLLALAGYGPDSAVIMQNPAAPSSAELQDVRRLLTSAARQGIPEDAPGPPPSIAAILHPDEPALPEFFAQMPAWARDLVVTWDADDVPGDGRRVAREHCPVPVTHLARALQGDFAAQRNVCLDAVQGESVLFVDGDERLDPEAWALIPRLAAMDVAGWRLPRRTLYPDADHCKIGYGLWPDFQLRLFRTGPGVAFQRPVHEIVTGLAGRTGVAPAASFIHLSRMLKDADQLSQKLQTFDKAGRGTVSHRLAAEYPSFPCAILDELASSWHSASLVLSTDRA